MSELTEIPKTYEPQGIEEKWYAFWQAEGCFTADPQSPKPAYSIVIPPPNVTGMLTLGHVLNNTIQDILARRARMLGKEVLWLPGVDHAGIATQTVVERMLKKSGQIRHRDDLGREKFLEKVWEWKEKHGGIIIQQLKKLGASCDWSRERFTMDPAYSACVQRVFVDLYKKGLIYRGKRMVNWDPAALTALSDEEVTMKPQKGTLYLFSVEVSEAAGTRLTIATTRPETIPGDTAVAVNPKDARYAHLIGKSVIRPLPANLPLPQKLIPIIGDEHVDFEFGTGVLKVTPAHDKADFEIGQRHGLAAPDIMNPDGTMNALAGEPLVGLDRFKAREIAVEHLRALGVLEKEEPYENNVGFSERSDVPVEPRLSEQWFLKYPSVAEAKAVVAGVGSALGGKSLEAHLHEEKLDTQPAPNARLKLAQVISKVNLAKSRMQFFPERWAKVYDHWLENIQDWCISRQLWWGHRVPVWRPGPMWDSDQETMVSTLGYLAELKKTRPGAAVVKFPETGKTATDETGGELTGIALEVCVNPGFEDVVLRIEELGLVQDHDVLDTWFSSWLWPFATMGWPEKTETLAKFYPTTDLVTGPDILFFWVARMIMAGFEYTGEAPFRNVYFTGLIRDKQGRKMSKSLGNSPDPLDLIAQYGADALRFGIMRSAPLGQDILFDEKNVELGRNFCTKLWNAARFRQMHGGETEGEINPVLLTSDDNWILLRLDAAIGEVTAALEGYQFSEAAQALYRFFWTEFCDWYLEASKAALFGGDEALKANTLAVLDFVLGHTLRLFHPFMPFITEELWHGLGYQRDLPEGQGGKTIMYARWPQPLGEDFRTHYRVADADQEGTMAKQEVVNVGRALRRDSNVPSNKKVRFILRPVSEVSAQDVEVLRLLLNAEALELQSAYEPPKGTPTAPTPLGALSLPLAGLVDIEVERSRLGREISKVEAELGKVMGKLANESFAASAPPKVVAEHRQRQADWEAKRSELQRMLESLE